jgi:pyruvate kinase
MDIIATIWKTPYQTERNARMMEAGVDTFRIKCSHGTPKEISTALQAARQQINNSTKPIKLLADLPEAKLRLGNFPQERMRVEANTEFRFLHGPESSDPHAYTPFVTPELANHLAVGDRFYIGDGHLELEVVTIHSPNEFIAKTLSHGLLTRRTGLTIPHIMDKLDHIVPEIDDILAELPKSKPDMVSFSFVRSQAMMHTLIDKLLTVTTSTWRPMVIAKIESQQGVENIDEILEVCHGIMVARGDLALNVPFEQLGLVQKRLVAKARAAGKYVIVATGALESLMHVSLPSRADILDVTNSCLDGASAIMLCPETAHSEHPERAVGIARSIISTVESS